MQEVRAPLVLGMEPSTWDINRGLGFTMTATLVLLAAVGLAIPATAPGNRSVYRVTAGIL